VNTLKTKAQAEPSNPEHPGRLVQSEEAKQTRDGQACTATHLDPQSRPDQESRKVSGIPLAGTAPATQPTDSKLAQLRVDWSNLSPLERSERLEVLIANDHSRRGLAKAIGCSEGSIRQHLRFSHLTDEERQAFEEGSMSGKKALRKAQERKVQERLAQLRVSQQDWTREINRLVKVTLAWLLSLDLNKPCLEQLIYELRGGPFNMRLAEFARYAPKPWEIPTDKDPEAVIKACRPKGDTRTMNGPDFLNFCFVWYARWSQRVMPDRKLRDRVLLLVEHRLLYAPASVSGS